MRKYLVLLWLLLPVGVFYYGRGQQGDPHANALIPLPDLHIAPCPHSLSYVIFHACPQSF